MEKETVDEIIFKTTKTRNRLMLELMARGAMRVGEVLKLTLADIHGRKLVLRNPKSGKAHEFVNMPQKVADRLTDYAESVGKQGPPIISFLLRLLILKHTRSTATGSVPVMGPL